MGGGGGVRELVCAWGEGGQVPRAIRVRLASSLEQGIWNPIETLSKGGGGFSFPLVQLCAFAAHPLAKKLTRKNDRNIDQSAPRALRARLRARTEACGTLSQKPSG